MAIETLSSRQSAAWKDRVLPPVEKVAEGVWAVPVPIPDNPLVYTYCYAIADGSGVVLIDPGWDGKDQYLALTSALADLGFKVSDIHGIAITHYHRDHIGLVPALLAKNPSAWVAMHGEDLRSIKRFYTNAVDLGTGINPNLNIARAYGVPEDRWAEVESLQVGSSGTKAAHSSTGSTGSTHADRTGESMSFYQQALRQLPDTVHVLDDGTELPLSDGTVRAMWTPGHTYGHSVFVREDDDLLFSGDHVLPTITPNIGLDSGAITHSLGDYLRSLEKIGQLDEEVAVLPAHGFRFSGLHDRKAELVDHHHARLDEIRARMEATDDHSVFSIAQGLHWSRGFDSLHNFNLFAALAETAAHMHYLGIDLGIGSLVGQD
ncbi:MBL fold metallo-hydrolase [Brevibacterium sp. S111]|uniref:MBL fold metallo-hydrolase n=1 Tax=unclassified Brevibacterium TaxID=2614124 RepID=UPI001081F74F|nr:MBL fold metallo-hydrolase [Brevibacterium sp. S111]TGD11000.1 MBL fold metallo-hydrolase [Brevibacterium sp. S111]